MQKNKFLDDLGISRDKYGTNFCDDKKDKRAKRWKKQRKKYGFDDRETWNLDCIFIEWLYSRLMMYCKANNMVDTTYHKIEWQGEEKNQQECIDILIEASKKCLLCDDLDDVAYEQAFMELCDLMPLWGKLLPYMSW